MQEKEKKKRMTRTGINFFKDNSNNIKRKKISKKSL